MPTTRDLFKKPRIWLGIAALQADAAFLGSFLFFQVYEGYLPCELCWWQRICMYPLALILSVAFFTKDRFGFLRYAVPLLVIGTGVSVFHNTLYYVSMWQRLHPTGTITTCSFKGPSCTAVYIEWLGFITIPFLALTAFAVIAFALRMYVKRERGIGSLA